MEMSRRRVMSIGCLAAAAACALVLCLGLLRARLRAYDRCQTHGFGLYLLCDQNALCVLVQDWRGNIAAEEVVEFRREGRKWQLRFVERGSARAQDMRRRALEAAARLRAEHRLDLPCYMEQAVADPRLRMMYYGTAPASAFTRLLSYHRRRELRLTSNGLGPWRALHSRRYHLVFRYARMSAPALGVAVFRDSAGELRCRLRKFDAVRQAQMEWFSPYERTGFRRVMSRIAVWEERS